MPGNVTTERSMVRAFLPVVWQKAGVTANMSAPGEAMVIPGMSIGTLPLPRDGSIITVGIVLTTPVTTGLIRFEVTKDGGLTGKQFDMTPASGVTSLWTFKPGELQFAKGDRAGLNWGSSASLVPTGTIEANVFIEVQW